MTDILVRIADSQGNWISKPIETLTDEELHEYIRDHEVAGMTGWSLVRRLVEYVRSKA